MPTRSRVAGVRISEFLQMLYDLEQTFFTLAVGQNEGIDLDHLPLSSSAPALTSRDLLTSSPLG